MIHELLRDVVFLFTPHSPLVDLSEALVVDSPLDSLFDVGAIY